MDDTGKPTINFMLWPITDKLQTLKFDSILSKKLKEIVYAISASQQYHEQQKKWIFILRFGKGCLTVLLNFND